MIAILLLAGALSLIDSMIVLNLLGAILNLMSGILNNAFASFSSLSLESLFSISANSSTISYTSAYYCFITSSFATLQPLFLCLHPYTDMIYK